MPMSMLHQRNTTWFHLLTHCPPIKDMAETLDSSERHICAAVSGLLLPLVARLLSTTSLNHIFYARPP